MKQDLISKNINTEILTDYDNSKNEQFVFIYRGGWEGTGPLVLLYTEDGNPFCIHPSVGSI